MFRRTGREGLGVGHYISKMIAATRCSDDGNWREHYTDEYPYEIH